MVNKCIKNGQIMQKSDSRLRSVAFDLVRNVIANIQTSATLLWS